MEAKDFKVLLLAIDDKPGNLTTLRAIVSDLLPAAKVLSALNGPKGIEIARAEDPDVILLDIAMPGMDGFEVCRRLKADERLGSIPVLFLTALRTDRDSRIKALDAGGDGFVSKPLNESELIAQIRAMAKIKAANRLQRLEKEQLATLVAERTRELAQELIGHKRTETALRNSEASYRAVTQTAADAIIIGNAEGNITGWNAAAEKIFGYTEAEVLGKPFTVLMPQRYWHGHAGGMDRLRAGGERHVLGRTVELYGLCKDGSEVPLELSLARWETADGLFITGIIRNIAERKQAEAARASLEAQLRESQKMETLGTLAGGVAHDFNNVLTVILSNVELARRELGPGHAALESLGAIGKASRRAKDLVQQILAFGRRQKLERKATSLVLVVVETARLLRATLPAKVSLSVDCKADTPAVLADATQVVQTLLNLCNNAFQALQDQSRPGVIEISLTAHSTDGVPYNDGPERRSRGERAPLRAGRYACLTVRDNGSGMDEATRARIFEPFFTTKSVGKGTGLGLSVVHSMVQAHEASIEVKSTPGEGSTFRIFFPAIDTLVPEVSAPIPDTTPVDGRGKHVLYVDDEGAIVFLMKRLLERQGYRVSGYIDPHEALAAARANPDQYDLVVTDYYMPGMSGLELAHALKEIRPDLPVVLASAYITEELRAQAPAAGIRELIYKPNTVDDLCEAVARFANTQSG